MADELGGLNGLLGDNEGLGGLASDESMRERDAANQNQQDLSMGFGDVPQSLSDFATQGMGEGLSAVKESLGMEGHSGIELSAALEDEEDDMVINAALEDEYEEEPIRAGRADPAPVNAGYGKPQIKTEGQVDTPAEERSSFDSYGIGESQKLSSNPSQNIDDIFIASSFNRGESSTAATSSGGGTMYSPKSQPANVHVSVGIPGWLKVIIFVLCLLAVAYGVLTYGFHVKVMNYFEPVDVEEYFNYDAQNLSAKLGVKMKDDKETYSSSVYEYTYDVQRAGGLKLVNYQDTRLYIEVTDTRIDYSIYQIRPQITKFDEAKKLLAAVGYSELESYDETEELGSEGKEIVFYNEKTGEGVIIGKKSQYDSVKAVKYVLDYKKFAKLRKELRCE